MCITPEDSKDCQVGTMPDVTALSDPTPTMMLKFGVVHTNGTFEAEGAFGGVSGHSLARRCVKLKADYLLLQCTAYPLYNSEILD